MRVVVSKYISNQTDFWAFTMASVRNCVFASGSTNNCNCWAPLPITVVLVAGLLLVLGVPPSNELVLHAVRSKHTSRKLACILGRICSPLEQNISLALKN